MIRILFFYAVIFFVSSLVTLNLKFRYLTLFLVLFQISLLGISLINIFSLNISKGISVEHFFLLIFSSLIVLILVKKFSQNKNDNFFKKLFRDKIVGQMMINMNNLVYFNKSFYYQVNTKLVLFEKLVRKNLKNPEQLMFLIFFIYTFLYFCTILELFVYNRIFFSLGFFLFFLFFYRIVYLLLLILQKIYINSVNFNFNEITFNLFFDFYFQNKNDFIFVFLNSERLNDCIFLDTDISEAHLLEKYQIISSILIFSRNWLLTKNYLFFYLPRIKKLLTFHLLLSIGFTLLLQHINSIPIFFDGLLILLLLNLFFFDKIQEKPGNCISTLENRLSTIPTFLEDLKNAYLEKGFVSEKIKEIFPRSIYVKYCPEKPGFLEGFEELPVYDETEDSDTVGEDDDDVEKNKKKSYLPLISTIFFISSIVLFIVVINLLLTNIQVVVFFSIAKFFINLQPLLFPIWNILKFIFLSTVDYIVQIFPKTK